MIRNISWNDYIVTVAIGLAMYYLFISLRYYSAEIKNLLSGKQKIKFRIARNSIGNNQREFVEPDIDINSSFTGTTDNEFDEVEQLIERLKTVIAGASRRKLIPQELKQYLGLVLKEYPSLRYSPLRSSINELIISECQKYGAVTLREEEAELLWKEAV
ncbi:hypothetical protein [Parafilimonas terrae]|uniref:Uncharacterized protein n=1 Tax=Parafilimonas terrae TaxID=1465490 RepID=A0A1I5XF70_9BACT|nr:hypothetical protein [Parafilimonas terrae]SFQ30611.1 hypothetical protein SAMN05444277_108141 [Parafilimonas terrae]